MGKTARYPGYCGNGTESSHSIPIRLSNSTFLPLPGQGANMRHSWPLPTKPFARLHMDTTTPLVCGKKVSEKKAMRMLPHDLVVGVRMAHQAVPEGVAYMVGHEPPIAPGFQAQVGHIDKGFRDVPHGSMPRNPFHQVN